MDASQFPALSGRAPTPFAASAFCSPGFSPGELALSFRLKAPCSFAITPSEGMACCDWSISRTRRRRSSTRSVRFVFLPPFHMRTPEAIPQPKANGIRMLVVHAGRSKRFIDHIQAASMHWKTELPSFKRQIHRAVFIGNALCVSVPWGRYQVWDFINFFCWWCNSYCCSSVKTCT